MKSGSGKRKEKCTLRILLVDDEKEYFEELKRAHPDCRFEHSNKITNVVQELEERGASGQWPDLLLLDVYWPKQLNPKLISVSREKTHRLLTREVRPAIDRMNSAYLSAFEKFGTRVLAQIRQRFSPKELPIIMYSSKGHFLLRAPHQDWISETIEHGASWLAKGTVTTNAEKLIFQSVAAKARSVFIGHGRSKEWCKLANFLDQQLMVRYEAFEGVTPAGIATKERLETMLKNSALAFLVATAEDVQKDGLVRARENVVHEIGLCQGRLGFEKAIVMLEEGCNEFSNIHGINQIRFPKGHIEKKFKEVIDVLKRERLLPGTFKIK